MISLARCACVYVRDWSEGVCTALTRSIASNRRECSHRGVSAATEYIQKGKTGSLHSPVAPLSRHVAGKAIQTPHSLLRE